MDFSFPDVTDVPRLLLGGVRAASPGSAAALGARCLPRAGADASSLPESGCCWRTVCRSPGGASTSSQHPGDKVAVGTRAGLASAASTPEGRGQQPGAGKSLRFIKRHLNSYKRDAGLPGSPSPALGQSRGHGRPSRGPQEQAGCPGTGGWGSPSTPKALLRPNQPSPKDQGRRRGRPMAAEAGGALLGSRSCRERVALGRGGDSSTVVSPGARQLGAGPRWSRLARGGWGGILHRSTRAWAPSSGGQRGPLRRGGVCRACPGPAGTARRARTA